MHSFSLLIHIVASSLSGGNSRKSIRKYWALNSVQKKSSIKRSTCVTAVQCSISENIAIGHQNLLVIHQFHGLLYSCYFVSWHGEYVWVNKESDGFKGYWSYSKWFQLRSTIGLYSMTVWVRIILRGTVLVVVTDVLWTWEEVAIRVLW